MDEEILLVTDEDGKELEMVIVMTFESEEFGKNYIVYREKGDDDGEYFAACYNPEDGVSGKLQQIESDEEWDFVEEVIESYLDEQEELKEAKEAN